MPIAEIWNSKQGNGHLYLQEKWTEWLEKPTHVDPVRQFSFDPRKFLFFDPFKCPG